MNFREYDKSKIPKWCGLSLPEHFDGCGGCWGIECGDVAKLGEKYCKTCEYYKFSTEDELV